MAKEVRSRTFKSGNSIALRLPKSLGISEGVEMRVREEQGRYVVEPVEAERKKINLSFLKKHGSFGMTLLKPEDREIDPSPGIEELMRKVGWGKPES